MTMTTVTRIPMAALYLQDISTVQAWKLDQLVPVTLLIVLLPVASQPLDQEENRGEDLEKDGEGEEGDEEVFEGSAKLQGVSELIGVGCEESNVHQTLG